MESPLCRHIRSVVGGLGAAARAVGRVAGLGTPVPSPTRPVEAAGGSTFQRSPAESALTEEADEEVVEDETPAQIQAIFERDVLETGNGGLSDEEGDEVDEHNRSMVNNDEDARERNQANEFRTDGGIPGQPDGWFAPGPPDGWTGYQPKHDAPATFSEVETPG